MTSQPRVYRPHSLRNCADPPRSHAFMLTPGVINPAHQGGPNIGNFHQTPCKFNGNKWEECYGIARPRGPGALELGALADTSMLHGLYTEPHGGHCLN
jgi:hypothetical protein